MRLPRVHAVRLLLMLMLSAACSDDDDKASDAGVDAGRDGSSGCRASDCEGMEKPRITCAAGSAAEFTCAYTFDQKCEWSLGRCVPGLDAGGDSTPGEAGADAGDAGDASTDAPVVDASVETGEETGPDAPADGP